MRWTTGGRSPNLEDRRGSRTVRGIPMGLGGLGAGGFVILLILSLVFKQDFFSLLSGDATTETSSGQVAQTPEEEREVQFVSFVLDDAQATWAKLFREQGRQWEDAKLVLFRDATQTACGYGESASGPFYCPGDHKVYVDLGFFEELRDRFGADGDFAQAYVIAHEIGHHVQALAGSAGMSAGGQRSNATSVRTELQADCYAGVWANSTSQRDLLENGDVEEGLAAAAAVGDDRIQRSTTGRVNPDAFTHGSSADRVRWFRQGLTTGKIAACDTFSG